jgi:hypothetical protein
VIAIVPVIIVATIAAILWTTLHRRGVDRCIVQYITQSLKHRARRAGEPTHVLLCIADHFEPRWGDASDTQARERVQSWVEQYPKLFAAFRDSDGLSPRHTFFFPIDQYDDQHVGDLARLCRDGFAEVEIHLHHDHDSAESLRRTLEHYKLLLSQRHGLLARRRDGGDVAFGFVHGNWALDNSRADGRWCGVTGELKVLRESGCYADFTLPSAPSKTQTRKINSIYYATGDPKRSKSHDRGVDVGTGPARHDSLMLIQGPLLPDWRRGKIENGCLQASQPPDMPRLELWLRANVHVPRRADWRFVKLHTHGAPERNQRILLGEAMVRLHRDLKLRSEADRDFHFHYVTAREMYNLARAAEAGFSGTVAEARDYELVSGHSQPAAITRPA